MSVLVICARYVIIILENLAKTAAVTEYYKTPWRGDPRINIQSHRGKAKACQVKQGLLALEKLEVSHVFEK
jgi:hypothetical protein